MHQDSVDDYLEDIITETVEEGASEEAKKLVKKLAKQVDDGAYGTELRYVGGLMAVVLFFCVCVVLCSIIVSVMLCV